MAWRLFVLASLCLSPGAQADNSLPDLLDALSSQTSLTQFTSYLRNATSLVSAAQSGGMTVLAPNDAAWSSFLNSSLATNYSASADALSSLLSYHILKGTHSKLSFSNDPQFIPTLLTDPTFTNVTSGQVVEAVVNGSASTFKSAVNHVSILDGPVDDILFSGGIIHIVDQVLLPPLNLFQSVTDAPLPYFIDLISPALNGQYSDLYQELSSIPNSTFLAANGPNMPSLFNPDISLNETLNLTKYTFIPGQVLYSTNFTNGSSFATASGEDVTITTFNGSIWINDVKVIWRDILIANGVLHAIDQILNSSHSDARPQLNITGSSSAIGSSGSLSTGAKAGIGVGVSLGVIVIVALIGFAMYKRRSKNTAEMRMEEPSEAHLEPQSTEMSYPAELDWKTREPLELENNSMQHPQELGGEGSYPIYRGFEEDSRH